MPETTRPNSSAKLVKLLVIANLCFWVYFAIAFAQVSYPFRADPFGHHGGAGVTFLGHSIGILESLFVHPFFKVMYWIQFPSCALAKFGENLLFPHITGEQFFAGISEGGWRLLVIILLSFLQWYFVGWVLEKLWGIWFGHPTPATNQAPG